MNDQNKDVPSTNQQDAFHSVEAIRELKTQLLFNYLKEKFELDRQLRLLNVSEQLAAINREHERALNELLKETK